MPAQTRQTRFWARSAVLQLRTREWDDTCPVTVAWERGAKSHLISAEKQQILLLDPEHSVPALPQQSLHRVSLHALQPPPFNLYFSLVVVWFQHKDSLACLVLPARRGGKRKLFQIPAQVFSSCEPLNSILNQGPLCFGILFPLPPDANSKP